MEEEKQVVGGGSEAVAEILEKVMQLQKNHEGQIQQLQTSHERQVRNLKQYIKDLKQIHAAELAKYAEKSYVDSHRSNSELLNENSEEERLTDPLKIPEVLEMILNNLEAKPLREVRSVCKLWNETWVRIVSKEPSCAKLEGDCISELSSLLVNFSAPEAIIQEVFCKGSYGDHSDYEENLQRLLKQFGHKVKFVNINQEKRVFSPLKSILVDSGEWCQNLEELNIHVDGEAEAGNFHDFILKENQLSRLKRLKFVSESADDDEESRVTADKHLLSTLIKASPNLECLVMDFQPDSNFKNVKVVTECVNYLKGYPNVTRNLKEFEIGAYSTSKFNPFKNLLEWNFSSKLKTLRLDCDYQSVFPKKDITELLKKVGDSLESLTIWGGPYLDVKTQEFEWPILPRLKCLNNYAQDQFELELGELKSKMPILKKLKLDGNGETSLIDKRCLRKLFDIEGPLQKFDHLTLKDLKIMGKIYSAKTPAAINRMFPNISELTIYIYPHKSDLNREPQWFQEAFEGLSQMKKLRYLTLCLRNYCFDESLAGRALCTAFKKLKNLPDLRFLTLICDATLPVGSNFGNVVITLLSECQGLKRLKLTNFTASASSVVECMKRKGPDTQLEFTDEDNFVNG